MFSTKSLATAILMLAGGHLVVAASELMQADWVNGIVHLATAGGFGALVWYLICVHIPAIEKRHKEEREADREVQKQATAAMQSQVSQLDRIMEHVRSKD